MDDSIKQAADAIRDADAIWIGAGAGMGVDSGLPDFRGNEGFWNAYPRFRKLGLDFYDLANPAWFHNDASRAWGFYGHRLNLYRQTEPHQGFRDLLQLVTSLKKDYFVFTSNVDGHFQKSGYQAENVAECHGSINFFQCTRNCNENIWIADEFEILIDEESMSALEPLPKCHQCHGIARPNILMFGDGSWNSSRTEGQYEHYTNWLRRFRDGRIVGLEFGAGTAVPTVRHQAESSVDQLIRINPREAHGPAGTISIELPGKLAIERIVACFD